MNNAPAVARESAAEAQVAGAGAAAAAAAADGALLAVPIAL